MILSVSPFCPVEENIIEDKNTLPEVLLFSAPLHSPVL